MEHSHLSFFLLTIFFNADIKFISRQKRIKIMQALNIHYNSEAEPVRDARLYGKPEIKGFAEVDQKIYLEKYEARHKENTPLIGDIVYDKNGNKMIFSHDWGSTIQVSRAGSLYLCKSGNASFSGGLYSRILVIKKS